MAAPPPAQPDASAPPPATVPVGQTSTAPSEPEEYVKPHIEQILSLHDFEAVARRTMNRRGWNYYSSGADDEVTLRENHNAYGRVWFRPRVLRNVSKVDFSTSIFGFKTSMPVYITATALGMPLFPNSSQYADRLGKLGHPEGEVALTRAAGNHDIIQMVSLTCHTSGQD
jgi:L-lactate dehydrogenase (cytochrome)